MTVYSGTIKSQILNLSDSSLMVYFVSVTPHMYKPEEVTSSYNEQHRLSPMAAFIIEDIPNANIEYSIEYEGSKTHAGYRYPFERDSFNSNNAGKESLNKTISMPIDSNGKQEILLWSCVVRHMQGHIIIKREGVIIYDADIDVTADWD